MRPRAFRAIIILSAAMMGTPIFAAPLSGGGSGGGAIEGGSGAPGGGVGIPGAIVNNTTAEGIGEDSTDDWNLRMGMYQALVTAPIDGAARLGPSSPGRLHPRKVQRSVF